MKKNFDMRYEDLMVTVLFVLALIAVCLAYGWQVDLYITVLAGIAVATSALTVFFQKRKIEDQLIEEN